MRTRKRPRDRMMAMSRDRPRLVWSSSGRISLAYSYGSCGTFSVDVDLKGCRQLQPSMRRSTPCVRIANICEQAQGSRQRCYAPDLQRCAANLFSRSRLTRSSIDECRTRKPLAKWRSKNRPTLNVQRAQNSLSQCPTHAISASNLRKLRHNFSASTLRYEIGRKLPGGTVAIILLRLDWRSPANRALL
jgi:hypothetical protein